MSNNLRYAGLATNKLSAALWGNVHNDIIEDQNRGVFDFDDFINHPAPISAQTIGKYATYIDTGVTLKSLPLVTFATGTVGVLEVAGNDATNDEGSITDGGGSGAWLKISDDADEKRGCYFEARVKKASISDTNSMFFLGLAEEGCQIADILVDTTGALHASKDFIGFHVLAAEGELVDFVFKKSGQTLVTVKAAVATLVADTWMKLGFRYQPWATPDKQIALFVNGVEQSTYVTATQIAAATFPDGEEMARLFATKNAATTTESKLHLDFWGAAQLLVPVG